MPKRFLLITAALIFFCSSAWAQLLNSPWPKIHKDVKNSGYTSNIGTSTGKLKWKFQPSSKAITSSPVLDNNNRLYFGSADKKVYCLDRITGAVVWTYETGDAIENSSPAIDVNNILYIGSNDGYLYAFDLDAIDPDAPAYLWRYQTFGGITGSPTIASDGTIIFGSSDGWLYALTPGAVPALKWKSANLGVIWSTPTIDEVYFERYNPLPLGGPVIAIGSSDPVATQALRLTTIGDPGYHVCDYMWDENFENRAYSNIFVLDLETGTTLYEGLHTAASDAIFGSIGIRGGGKYIIPFQAVGTVVDYINSTVQVYDPGTGTCTEELAPHEYEVAEGAGAVYGTPAVLPESSFYIGQGSTLYRIYPSSSDYFAYNTAGRIESSPAVDGSLSAYVGCNGGVFYCINSLAPNNPLRWRYPETGSITKTNGQIAEIISSTAIDNDKKHSVYFGASDGAMYAFYDGPSIKGKVTTDGTTPLAACEIILKDSKGTAIDFATTDILGTFEFFALPSGQYTVVPKKSGLVFNPNEMPVTLGNSEAYIEFIAAVSFTITGRVVRASDGTGLPNVAMSLITRNDSGMLIYSDYSVVTNAAGYYTFVNIGFGTTEVTPFLPGWGFSPPTISRAIPGGTAGGQTFTLANFQGTLGYQASGTVTDSATGLGLANVTIRIEGGASFTPVEVTTDSNGAYSITSLANGTYLITPTLTSYIFTPKNLAVVISNANALNQNFSGRPVGSSAGGLLNSPWPKFHNDVKNSGFTTNVGTAIGKIKWKYVTEKPVTSSPALDNNNRLYFGSADKNLYCLDRSTGGLIWKYATGDAILNSSPAIDVNGILYIGSSDHNLYAFDTTNIDVSNPQPLWTFATNDGIHGSPNIARDGTIIFGSADGFLYALNPTNPPSVKWKINLGTLWSTPTIDYVYPTTPPYPWYTSDPIVLIGSTQYSGWTALKAAPEGARCEKEYDTTAPLVASTFYLLDLETGDLKAYGLRSAVEDGIGIYGSIGIQPGGNYIVPFEGKGVGVGPIGADSVISGSSCVLVPNTVDTFGYASSADQVYGTPTVHPTGFFYIGVGSTLIRVDPSLSTYFSFSTEGRIESSIALDGNGNAYFGCNGGVFYCINSDSPLQPLRWRYPETGNLVKTNGDAAEIISSPAIDKDVKHSIYFGASDGAMYAFYDGASIRGLITTDGTTPLAAVQVILKNSAGVEILATSTDTEGRFEFFGMGSGQYTVIPKKDGYIFNPVEAPVTLTNVDTYIEFTADLAFTINGRIINSADGTGLPNVSVGLITKNAAGVIVYTNTSTATDLDGYYTFTNIGFGTTIITPSLEGWSFTPPSLTQSIPVNTAGGATYTLDDFEGTLGYQISGRVIDVTLPATSNNGIAGVTIRLTGTLTGGGPIPAVEIQTDENGAFSFIGLYNGSYTVSASSSVYKFDPAAQPAIINNGNALDLLFQGTPGSYFVFNGRIINSAGGAGLPNVAVSLVTRNAAGDIIYTDNTIKTDSLGYYTISNISYGTTVVTPTLAGWGFSPPSVTQDIPVGTVHPEPYTLTDMAGTLGFQISGTVTDATRPNEADNGLDGVTLTLTGTPTGGTAIEPPLTLLTDATGTYSFTGLANGTYTVTPSGGGYKFDYTEQEVIVNNASVLNVNFQGAQGIKISGFVQLPPTETSYEGFSVNLYLDDVTFWSRIFNPNKPRTLVATTLVNSKGGFTFIVAAGKYIVEPVAAGYSFDPESENITALITDISGLIFTASSGLSVSGRLTSIFGFPQSGITVLLVGITNNVALSTITGIDGNYTFVGIAPGTYTVAPQPSASYTASPLSRSITVDDLKVTKVNFTIISFCTKTYLAIPPFGTTGTSVGIIGTNFGPTPDPNSTDTVDVTLSDGTTASVPAGVYFGSNDPATWIKATVSSWTPFYITAEVPALDTRVVRVWVVRSGASTCINITLTNYFINTNQ